MDLRHNKKQKGFTVLGIVIALVILAIMASKIGSFVAANQSTRTQTLNSIQTFYSNHAAIEFSLRQILQAGNPDTIPSRDFSEEPFDITRSLGKILVTTQKGSAKSSFNIIDPNPVTQASCLTVETSGAFIGGGGDKELHGLTFQKNGNCSNNITLISMTVSWQPDGGEKLKRIQIDSVNVYDDASGRVSGEFFDITDVPIQDSNSHTISLLRWNNEMEEQIFTLIFHMNDGSQKTEVVDLSEEDD